MIINKYSITHWTMIWEEEGHHISINHEKKYKYTFSSSWAPHETLIWLCFFSSQRNSTSKLCYTRRWSLGKRWGKESSNSSSITMKRFKSSLMELPTSIYIFLKRQGRRQSIYNWRSQLHNHPNYPNFEKCIFDMNTRVAEKSITHAGGTHGLQCN